MYGFRCPYLHNTSQAFVFTAISALFFGTVSLWLKLSHHKPATAGERPPNHIIFITRAYRRTYSYWETERLVRKTLLKVITAALPVTYSPSLQMLSVSLVLLSSMSLYAILQPYQSRLWNNLEIGLLTAAAVMTCLTSCMLSNELHWGRTSLVQRLLLLVVAAMGGGISFALAFRYSTEMLREARQPKNQGQRGSLAKQASLEMVPGIEEEAEAEGPAAKAAGQSDNQQASGP